MDSSPNPTPTPTSGGGGGWKVAEAKMQSLKDKMKPVICNSIQLCKSRMKPIKPFVGRTMVSVGPILVGLATTYSLTDLSRNTFGIARKARGEGIGYGQAFNQWWLDDEGEVMKKRVQKIDQMLVGVSFLSHHNNLILYHLRPGLWALTRAEAFRDILNLLKNLEVAKATTNLPPPATTTPPAPAQ